MGQVTYSKGSYFFSSGEQLLLQWWAIFNLVAIKLFFCSKASDFFSCGKRRLLSGKRLLLPWSATSSTVASKFFSRCKAMHSDFFSHGKWLLLPWLSCVFFFFYETSLKEKKLLLNIDTFYLKKKLPLCVHSEIFPPLILRQPSKKTAEFQAREGKGTHFPGPHLLTVVFGFAGL